MININKVVKQIHNDGRYDAILDVAKKALDTNTPTLESIEKLVLEDPYYIIEYKDLNRWGELSSIHIKELEINDTDSSEAISLKEKINEDMTFLKNREEYEVASKDGIYLAWTGFIALPSIYVIDNMVRLFTDLYIDKNEMSVYISFVVVIILSAWGYLKVSRSHKNLHHRYIQTQKEMRKLISLGIEKEYFTLYEVYED